VDVAARTSGALLVLAAGAVHLWLWFDYFHRVHVLGALFLANAVSAAAISAAIFLSAGVLPLIMGALYALGTLAGFFVSVTVGLFGYTESLFGTWQVIAAALEVAAVVVLFQVVRIDGRRLG
jgi:hypothetical protein